MIIRPRLKYKPSRCVNSKHAAHLKLISGIFLFRNLQSVIMSALYLYGGPHRYFSTMMLMDDGNFKIYRKTVMKTVTDYQSIYLKAKLTQLIRKTSIARQNTPKRAYIPISRSDSPLVVWVSSLSPGPGTSTCAG